MLYSHIYFFNKVFIKENSFKENNFATLIICSDCIFYTTWANLQICSEMEMVEQHWI